MTNIAKSVFLPIVALIGATAQAQLFAQAPPNQFYELSDGIDGQIAGFRAWDEFQLTADSDVGAISWAGGANVAGGSLENFNSFVVGIYTVNFNFEPGALIESATILTEDTNPIDTGLVNVSGGHIYEQSADLPDVHLGAGFYYLTVGSVNTDPNGPSYGWATADSGFDGAHLAEGPWGSGSYFYSDGDLTMLVSVPEPASFAAVGLGIALLLASKALRSSRP
jgi:hypothetical protein